MAISPELAVAGIGAGLALVTFSLVSQAEEKRTVRQSLRGLDGYETVENQRDRELLNPLRERALIPVLHGMTRLGRRFTPVGYVDGVRQKFVLAGQGTSDAVDRFLAIRVATVALIPFVFWFFMILNPLAMTGTSQMAVFALTVLALGIGPDAKLNRRVQERQRAVLQQLPDILDLLTISVEAGLGFEQALDRTIGAVPGPLTEEFARMLGETRAGSSRAEAMRALEARLDVPEVRSFVLAILQADTFGISIGRVLRSQADEMRIRRRQLAQERAQKAPVKMLIPMVFCIFPPLFIIVLGPAGITLTSGGGI
jgi:tight adherence protein C